MEKLNVLIVCGAGASSGFLANAVRKAAKKQGLDLTIKARSETEIENFVDEIDALLIAPHLQGNTEVYRKMVEPKGVKVMDIKREHYGILDGAGVAQDIIDLFK